MLLRSESTMFRQINLFFGSIRLVAFRRLFLFCCLILPLFGVCTALSAQEKYDIRLQLKEGDKLGIGMKIHSITTTTIPIVGKATFNTSEEYGITLQVLGIQGANYRVKCTVNKVNVSMKTTGIGKYEKEANQALSDALKPDELRGSSVIAIITPYFKPVQVPGDDTSKRIIDLLQDAVSRAYAPQAAAIDEQRKKSDGAGNSVTSTLTSVTDTKVTIQGQFSEHVKDKKMALNRKGNFTYQMERKSGYPTSGSISDKSTGTQKALLLNLSFQSTRRMHVTVTRR